MEVAAVEVVAVAARHHHRQEQEMVARVPAYLVTDQPQNLAVTQSSFEKVDLAGSR